MFEDDGMPNKFLVQPMTEPAKTTAMDDARVMRLWRECGLPEYFLGNGGTNLKLVDLARRIVDDATKGHNMVPHVECDLWRKQQTDLESAEAQLSEQRTTIERLEQENARLIAAIEKDFGCIIHASTSDPDRQYCQCGWAEDRPIHTLASDQTGHPESEREYLVIQRRAAAQKVQELQAKVTQLEQDRLKLEGERDRWKAEHYAGAQLHAQYRREAKAEFKRNSDDIEGWQAQVAQLQTTISQLRALITDHGDVKPYLGKITSYAEGFNRCNAELRSALATITPKQEKGE